MDRSLALPAGDAALLDFEIAAAEVFEDAKFFFDG